MIKTTYPIKGMHCRACEITLGEHLEKVPEVLRVTVSLKKKTAVVESLITPNKQRVTQAIEHAGYEIGTEVKPRLSHNPADYKDFFIGVIIIGILVIIYNSLGLNGVLTTGNISSGGLGVALVTGIVAGLSTCMALVGGLVLGLSAGYAKKHPTATAFQKFRPHLFFNFSRIVAFFLLGGIIGLSGSLFQLQGISLGILTILVGLVMLTMGLQLTNLFPRLSNGGLTLPPSLAKRLGLRKHSEKEYSHKNAVALGAISFFLPCGFTQVMQLYAISTGSFVTGALVMGLFALGTAPGLLGIGGLTSAIKSKASGRFFKVAGVAVMGMALLNISNGFNLTGFPLSQLASQIIRSHSLAPVAADGAILTTTFTFKGDISPNEFTVAKGGTYTLKVDSKEDGQGCMSTIMIPGLFKTPLLLVGGQTQVLTFTATKAGVYNITCAMGVYRGTITVV